MVKYLKMRTQAIILKKIPVREYDELLVCYTKDTGKPPHSGIECGGKQTYQAKSILRPSSKQAGHLDILNLVDFSLVKKNSHPIITSAYCLEAFRNLKSSLPALATAYFLLECFDKLIFEGESDPKLWDFLHSRLNEYDQLARKGERNWPAVINAGRQELLGILGYDKESSLESLAGASFRALQFAREVVRLTESKRSGASIG